MQKTQLRMVTLGMLALAVLTLALGALSLDGATAQAAADVPINDSLPEESTENTFVPPGDNRVTMVVEGFDEIEIIDKYGNIAFVYGEELYVWNPAGGTTQIATVWMINYETNRIQYIFYEDDYTVRLADFRTQTGAIEVKIIYEHLEEQISNNNYRDFGSAQEVWVDIKPGEAKIHTENPYRADAAPISATVLVDGKTIAFDAYNINGNNYFKLRDIAKALSGSKKQFEVGWNELTNAITLTGGQAYTLVGGELASGDTDNKEAKPTASKIHLDDYEVRLTAYNIGGNNYLKLRDLGAELDFGVDWNDATRTITIDTAKGYAKDGITINAANFPDPKFRAFLTRPHIDRNHDGILSASEIAEVTEIIAIRQNIADLQGIEFFTELEMLACSGNRLTALDVSKNTKLETLICSGNRLTALNVSKNINLAHLDCSDNQLTVLDISTNIDLGGLNCSYNQLTALDVSNNAEIVTLACSNNQLAALDVSKNIKLMFFKCSDNQLTALDVSNNIYLTMFSCNGNQLTVLDISNKPYLISLDCSDNYMASEAAVVGLDKSVTTEFTFEPQNTGSP